MKKLSILILVVLLSVSISNAQSSKMDFGGNLGTNYLVGDSPIEDSFISPNIGLFSIYRFSPKLSFKLQAGFGQLKTNFNSVKVTTNMIPIELVGMYYLKRGSSFLPFLHAGVGVMSFTLGANNFTSDRYYDGIFIGGTGFQMPVSPKLSFLASADLRYTTGDDFNIYNGGLGDGYFSVQGGLTYHFSKPEQFEKQKQQRQSEIIADLLDNPAAPATTQNQVADGSQDNFLDLIQLRSTVEELNNDLDKKNAQIEELKTLVKIKNQKISLYETQVAEAQNTTPQTTQRPREITEARRLTDQYAANPTLQNSNVKQRYDNAINNFNSRNYRAAIIEFTELSNEFPQNKLVGNFIYWIGESYFGMKNYSAAIEAFNNVIKHKTSPKNDDALLMAGIGYVKLGDGTKAKQKFEELLSKFPESEYSGKAKSYLQTLQTQVIS
jgi:tol-pal system protein YbgF